MFCEDVILHVYQTQQKEDILFLSLIFNCLSIIISIMVEKIREMGKCKRKIVVSNNKTGTKENKVKRCG